MPDHDLLARLLLSNSCYEAMPVSGRMIIFDQELLMWRAFTSLIKNGELKSVPCGSLNKHTSENLLKRVSPRAFERLKTWWCYYWDFICY